MFLKQRGSCVAHSIRYWCPSLASTGRTARCFTHARVWGCESDPLKIEEVRGIPDERGAITCRNRKHRHQSRRRTGSLHLKQCWQGLFYVPLFESAGLKPRHEFPHFRAAPVCVHVARRSHALVSGEVRASAAAGRLASLLYGRGKSVG